MESWQIMVLFYAVTVLGVFLGLLLRMPTPTEAELELTPSLETAASRLQNGAIPLTAHFVFGLWDTGPMPDEFARTVRMWQAQGWNTQVWDKAAVETLMGKYPEWETLYRNLSRPVQQADLARYVIVFDQGGFYFDLDNVPVDSAKPLKHYVQQSNKSAIYFLESVQPESWVEHTARRFPIREGVLEHPERLANFAFGAVAQHESLQAIMDLVVARVSKNPGPVDNYGVLYTTGPDAVTDALQTWRRTHNQVSFAVLPHKLFMEHRETGTWR